VSELTWYSRFAVWVGAAVLLVQAIAGRGAGLMSLIAVVLMAAGLMAFLAGLVVDGRAVRAQLEPALTESDAGLTASDASAEPDGDAGLAAVLESEPSAMAETATLSSEPEDSIPAPGVLDSETGLASPREVEMTTAARFDPVSPEAQHPVPRATPAAPRRSVPTHELDEGTPELGSDCPRCGKALVAGQVIAACPMCGAAQHASCWIENHFRCSTPGCAGAGSLEAPEE
jgi:hypothetical protein